MPQDIAVKASYKVNNGFSVQRDAISREYNYLILNSPTRSPLKKTYTYQVSSELNIEEMNQAGRDADREA